MNNTFKKILGAALLIASLSYPGLNNAFAAEAGNASSAVFKERVSAVNGRLQAVTGLKARVIVIPDASGNAYVLPDKTVVLTTGLESYCKSDDELAFIIAHEVSHIIAKDHYNEYTPALSGMKYVPDHELCEINADKRAVIYTRKAGYNPDGSVGLLARITPASNVYFKGRLEALVEFLKTMQAGLH